MGTSKPFQLMVVYETVEEGRIQASVPALPGTISVGLTRSEARENAIDALRELLAAPATGVEGRSVEILRARLDVHLPELERGL